MAITWIWGIFNFVSAVPNWPTAWTIQVDWGWGFWDVDEAGGIWVAGAGTDQWANLINIIKNFINWVLGLLGLIALVVLLRGGFQMVTAAGDEEKYKTGFKILKQAAVGLIFIGLAWFMVSIIFRVIGTAGGAGTHETPPT